MQGPCLQVTVFLAMLPQPVASLGEAAAALPACRASVTRGLLYPCTAVAQAACARKSHSLNTNRATPSKKRVLTCAGYMDVPASLPEERGLLIDLFGLCLAGDAALHTRLVDALFDLSAVEAECRGVGTAASFGPEQPLLANVVAEAICGIKFQVCYLLVLCILTPQICIIHMSSHMLCVTAQLHTCADTCVCSGCPC